MHGKQKHLITSVLALVWLFDMVGCGSSEPARCNDCDLTGLWVGRFQSEGTSANGNYFVDIAQSGTALTGTFSSSRLDLKDAPLSGTQDGGNINFGVDMLSIAFEGVVTEELTASGGYSIPNLDQGQWWAARADAGEYPLTDCFNLASENRPNGLAHDGENFWVITSGRVLKLDNSGTVLSEFERPGATVGGDPKATFSGGALWYVNGFEIIKLDTIGNELSRHEDPKMELHMKGIADVDGELWAVEDGGDLIQVDGSLTVSKTIETPVRSTGGLAWDGALMWVISEFNLSSPVLYAVDLSGWVRGYYQLPQGTRLTDLTFDGQSLWVADAESSRVCRLR